MLLCEQDLINAEVFLVKISADYDQNNKNFFDIEKEFFIIDSEHLEDVQTRFYGFSVQSTGIFENPNLTETAIAGLDGCGAYIYIERQQEEIRIKQDFNGAYGIYIYRSDTRFVLSNSFFRLMDYIKYKVPLSLDRDYANHILLDGLASHAYSETPVNEIKLLDKDIVITIDISTKKLSFQIIKYGEDSYSIDSSEGMNMLDTWFNKWTAVFRNLQVNTNQIIVDLSGGFDSRITFLLVLKSGLNLNEININSSDNNLHTHAEDYEIASQIADYYGFKLNNRKNIDGMALHYSLQDIINLSFYTKMAFHKEMYFKYHKFAKKRFHIPGAGGESVRAHWDVSPQKFADQMAGRSNRYSKLLTEEMGTSTRKILQNAYQAIEDKHHIGDPESIKYPLNVHREIRCRSHFGKAHIEDYFSNTCTLAPLIDPYLRKINLDTPDCPDNNLLMAVIYMRYCPELLKFKFEGKREINAKTIQFAKELNDKFPRHEIAGINEKFSIITEDQNVLNFISRGENNQAVPGRTPEHYLREVFNSCVLRKLFATYFDEEIYLFADNWDKRNDFFSMRHCYAIIGLVRVIEDIMLSRNLADPSVIKSMDRYICQNCYEPEDSYELIGRLRNYLTARIDIKSVDFELQDISDNRAQVDTPTWLQKNGKGYKIESYKGELKIAFKINADGKINIGLKSKDIKDNNGDRIPYWIDYSVFNYNGVQEFMEPKAAWHDKPVNISHDVKKGEIVYLHVEWMPCKADDPNNQLLQTEKKLKDKERQLNVIEEKLKKNTKKLNSSLSREKALKQSLSFRVGRAITWLPRKVRDYLH